MTMVPLFSEAGRDRLDAIARPGLLCAFDFDGTLAPIVTQPEQARLPDEVKHLLNELSVHAPLAVITGRSLEDIRSRFDVEADFTIGNHGIEGLPGWEADATAHRAAAERWHGQLVQLLQEAGDDPCIEIEDKRYSLSVHYRMCGDPERTAVMLRGLFGQLAPVPRIVAGKFVFNLVSEDAAHKGSALERLMHDSGARHALFVGDDVTDEDVFRLRRADLTSIRVERASSSAAPFFLPRQEDVLQLLRQLLDRLRAHRARNWIRYGNDRERETEQA
jgi:trehalose 6-phosphate phosphatase